MNRVDFTEKTFFAIDADPRGDIDDAIHVSTLEAGGFAVSVAIADGSQLSDRPGIIDQAIAKKTTTYDRQLDVKFPIIPQEITDGLHLSAGVRPALVVNQDFSADMRASAAPEVVLADVSVEKLSFEALAQQAAGTPKTPLLEFNNEFRKRHDFPLTDPEREKRFGDGLIETYMLLANLAVAKWAAQKELPVIYRNMAVRTIQWSNAYEGEPRDKVLEKDPRIIRVSNTVEAQRFTRVTSPLRRASDLVNHLQIGNHLTGKPLPYSVDQLRALVTELN